jgi:hypothetical protein
MPNLVLGRARGDVGVAAGLHVRIDPEGDRRALAHLLRHRRQAMQFGHALDVELEDAALEPEAHFLASLGDAGEHDAISRNAGLHSLHQLAARHHVGARAQRGEGGDHAKVRVGFDRIGDQQLLVGEGFGQHVVMAAQCGVGIDIGRRAKLARDSLQRDILAVQDAIAIAKVIHRRVPAIPRSGEVAEGG